MALDFVLANARIDGNTVDIGVLDGRIAAIAPSLMSDAPRHDAGGHLVVPGFIETHIHLDKSHLLDRCNCHGGTLQEAVAAVARAKRAFTEADVYARAARTLEISILHGTTRMRTHVEVDPRVGLTSLHALRALRQDYAWAIDLQLCAFPQEGLLDDPGCEEVLVAALQGGADLVGGAPYMDRDPKAHIARIFALAKRFDLDIDFHIDFSLDTTHLDVEHVCRQADALGWGGRVTAGHVTKLSALSPSELDAIGRRMAASGVALTVLPATDLFLMGSNYTANVPRGVAPAHRLLDHGVICSIATNNVLNPFTPFGDGSLLRMANLYANVLQLGTSAGMKNCLDMITTQPARLMRLTDYGLELGKAADLVVLACETETDAVRQVAPTLFGFKRGQQTFINPAARLLRPASAI